MSEQQYTYQAPPPAPHSQAFTVDSQASLSQHGMSPCPSQTRMGYSVADDAKQQHANNDDDDDRDPVIQPRQGTGAPVYSSMNDTDSTGVAPDGRALLGGGGGNGDGSDGCCCAGARCTSFRTAFRTKFCYVAALLLTALNLLFFLCLSVLLVMIAVDILITLTVQTALPPTDVYAFGGAALICVVFPWISVWVAVVADYSRWPSKFFLIHYHLRVALRVQEPLPIVRDPSSPKGAGVGGGGAAPSALIYSLWNLHEEERDEQEVEEAITRSKVQVLIACIPLIIWFVSLAIGVTVGKQHETGTVFFLTCGFLLVLFVTSVEYDTAPTSAAHEIAYFRWRPATASSMRHILLTHRKFDLGLVGIFAALLVTIVIFAKDASAIGGGTTGFVLTVVVLGIAIIALFVLRLTNALDSTTFAFDLRSGHANSQAPSARVSAAVLAQHDSQQRFASTQKFANSGNPSAAAAADYGTVSLASQVESAQAAAASRVRPTGGDAPAAAAPAYGNYSFTDASSMGGGGGGTCTDANGECAFSWGCFTHVLRRHREFALLCGEIITLVIAATALSAQNIEDTWPIWLMVLSCATCSVSLWFMNVQLKINEDAEERGIINNSNQPGAAAKNLQTRLALKVSQMNEETQSVFSYTPPKHPPDSVYRISYFVVGFVAFVIVVTSFFDDRRVTAAVCANCPTASAGASTTTSTTAIPTTTTMPWRRHSAYSACSTLFPGYFSIVDVAAIAAVSEMQAQRYQSLATFFPGSNDTASKNYIEPCSFNPSTHVVAGSFLTLDYYSFRMPNRNVTVIAARAAYSSFQALQQLYILSDAVSLEVAIMLVPLPFSDRLLSAMLRVVSLFKFGTRKLPNYIHDQANAAAHAHAGDDILLVGFSLGGFVSNIAAAQLNNDRITSVTIAPIGSGYQTKRFGFALEHGDSHVTSVVSEDDVIARFDMQMGMRQKLGGMTCGLENSFCHSTRAMMNQLSDVCQDELGRSVKLVDSDF